MAITEIIQVTNAAKGHRCTWCGEDIEKGERYFRWRDFYGGPPPATIKMHPECREAFRGCDDEWDFYGYQRGCLCPHGDCRCRKDDSEQGGELWMKKSNPR